HCGRPAPPRRVAAPPGRGIVAGSRRRRGCGPGGDGHGLAAAARDRPRRAAMAGGGGHQPGARPGPRGWAAGGARGGRAPGGGARAVQPSDYAAVLDRARGSEPAGDPASAGGGPLVPTTRGTLAGPLDPALLDCLQRLRAAHEQLVALEADLVEWDDDFLFALGEPNPTAERALAPLVEQMLTKGRFDLRARLPLRPRVPILEHRFGCRSWACRVALRLGKDG